MECMHGIAKRPAGLFEACIYNNRMSNTPNKCISYCWSWVPLRNVVLGSNPSSALRDSRSCFASHRFLVHRYSVLQHNAEVNGIEGVDEPLDTTVAAPAKIEFHDDSDEVGLNTNTNTQRLPQSLQSSAAALNHHLHDTSLLIISIKLYSTGPRL